MATSSNTPLASSSIYRNIYNGLRHSPVDGQLAPADGQLAPADERGLVGTSKWSFVQKLLAIEEAHDRRRKRLAGHTVGRGHKHGRSDTTGGSTSLPDVLSRWLHLQVLVDSPERPPSSAEGAGHQEHLPAINNGQQLSEKPAPLQRQLETSLSSRLCAGETQGTTLQQLQSEEEIPDKRDRARPLSVTSWCRDDDTSAVKTTRKRPLRLPPILLPRLYTLSPRPLRCREFLTPTKIRGPVTDDEWEDLRDCRYIRHAVPRSSVHGPPSEAAYRRCCTDRA